MGAHHGEGERAERDRHRAPDGVEQAERCGRRRDRHERADPARDHDAAATTAGQRHRATRDQGGDADPDDPHQHDVGPQRGDPAIGEDERLHHQDAGHHQHGGPRPDKGDGQCAAQEVSGGPGRDREVDHLRGEDEARGQPGADRPGLPQLTPRPAQRAGQGERSHGSGRHRGGDIEEAIGHVHGATLSRRSRHVNSRSAIAAADPAAPPLRSSTVGPPRRNDPVDPATVEPC
ncbi:hypothetical protein SDC9_127764 [bioreactor metagenome]|uniref:Uncharacterized protein n=1 Tax=bioreactor metagenome TaxID=1076179 RepID=A0A645CUZ0_9ZZZZ